MNLFLQTRVFLCFIMTLLTAGSALFSAEKILLDESFNSLGSWKKKNEKGTISSLSKGRVLLGGKSSTGDQCGLYRNDLNQITDWQMMLNISWSHNNAVGGHPTIIEFADAEKNGYRLYIANRKLELQKVKDGKVTSLGKSAALWKDFKTPKTIYFSRDTSGNMTAWLGGTEKKLTAKDDEFKSFNSLYIGYKVYCHGFSAIIDRAVVKSNDADSSTGGSTLNADTEILFNNQGTFSGWKYKHEKATAVQAQANRIVLGGKGSNGDKCGMFRNDLEEISNWQMMLSLRWSHNNAIGGHPTTIKFADASGNGYSLCITNGIFELDKIKDGNTVSLGKSQRLWNDATSEKKIFFTRDSSGNISAWVDGVSSKLNAKDSEFNSFNTLGIEYGVYCHGFAALISQAILKTNGKKKVNKFKSVIAPAVSWRFPDKVIGIIDFEDLVDPFLRTGWTDKSISILKTDNCQTKKIKPGTLNDYLDKIDVLIINPGFLAQKDIIPLYQYLKSGKAIWLAGTSLFGSAIYNGSFTGWNLINNTELPLKEHEIIHVIKERGTGDEYRKICAAKLKNNGEITVTDDGRKIWPFTVYKIAVESCSMLPWNDSISKQAFPPWVKRENLLTCKYTKRNWIFQNDTFTGIVAELMRHSAGEFSGCRMIFTGLPLSGDSPLNPSTPDFKSFSISLLNNLVPSVEKKEYHLDHKLASMPPLTRENLFYYPGNVFAPLCFKGLRQLNDRIFEEDLKLGGFAACQFSVLWLHKMTPDGEIVDWENMDAIVDYLGKINKKVIFDPYHFQWKSLKWSNKQSIHDPVFRERFIKAMEAISQRYKDNPTFVGMMITPHTHTYSFKIDSSAEGRIAWVEYLKNRKKYTLQSLSERYDQKIDSWEQVPLPVMDKTKEFNMGPAWSDYWDFHSEAYMSFMRNTIKRIRAICPNLPLLMRGPYMEVGMSMSIASEFKNVACHCECVETSIDTEGFFRALGKRFNVPIGAENGWPKAPVPALKMAMADYLMGNYNIFLYSFAGPRWARDCFEVLYDAAMVKRQMGTAEYPASSLAVLIPDTTLFSSRPANFFSMEKRPHIEGNLERLGYYFEGVSAAFPKLDGLKIIIADGSSDVISRNFRDKLGDWICNGGTFIMYPHTARYTLDGSATLAVHLKIKASPGTHKVGKGQIIVKSKIPKDDTSLDRTLKSLNLKKDFEIAPYVSNTTLKSGTKRYLIMYNKRRKLMESFFTESWMDGVLKKLEPTQLTIKPNFKFTHVKDMRTGKQLSPVGGTIKITMPATDYIALEFK